MAYLPNNSITSTVNSTATPLAAGAIFTGVSEDISQYASVTILVFTDQISAVDGLSIQQSSNGTNWDSADVYTIPVTSAGNAKTFGVQVSGQFFRIVYTNGATAQTSFRLHTQFHAVATPSSSVRPQDGRGNDNDMSEVLSYEMLYDPATDSWSRALRGSRTIANSQAVAIANDQILPIRNVNLEATATAGALNTDVVASVDLQNYRAISLQITGTWVGTLSFQGSNNNTDWVSTNLFQINNTAGAPVQVIGSTTGANLLYYGPVMFRYFRVRMTAYTSGSATGTAEFTTLPSPLANSIVSAAQVGNWSSVMLTAAGINVLTGNGVTGTGSLRVTVASDNTPFNIKELQPATPTLTSVTAAVTAQAVLAANTARRQAMLFNDSTSILYLRFGGTATTATGGYTVQVAAKSYYELPYPAYTGALSGIWAAANGAVSVTEIV